MTHITIPRETVQQAIDALQTIQGQKIHSGIWATCEYLKGVFSTALEAKDVEPVVTKDVSSPDAWLITSPDGDNLAQVRKPTALLSNETAVPLFAYHLPLTTCHHRPACDECAGEKV